jgi:hypothetical protein
MSSFSLPPLSGGINFDVSQFTGGMQQIAARAGEFPGMIQGGIDAPLDHATEAMGHAGEAAGEMGHGVEHGMMAAEAAMQLFPPLVIELIENPMLGAIATVKEFGEKFGDIVGEVAQHFESINLESIKLGIDPAELSAYEAAAKSMGVGVDSFTNGLKLMQDRAANAIRGDAGSIKAFEDLGIGLSELKDLISEPIELMNRMSDSMVELQGTGKLTQAAMESLGRGGTEMLPFMLKGSEGMLQLAESFGHAGAEVGEQEAAMGAMWQSLSTRFGVMWEDITTKLAMPVLGYLSDHLEEIMPKITDVATWLGDGIGGAMKGMIPWIETAWGVASGLGSTLMAVIAPALDAILPILKVIGEVVKFIMDAAGAGLNTIASMIHSASGFVTGDYSAANADWDRSMQSYRRMDQDLGLAPAGDTINIQAVHVTGDSSALDKGNKLQKEIDDAKAEFKRSNQAEHTHRKVAHATGGRHH